MIRGASIELLALLESGDLDYAFEYESVIRQHDLQMVALPDAINLGSAAQSQNYDNVVIKLDFRRFASLKPVFRGEPIGYGITIPSNAPQPELARRFIEFLLGPQGRQIMLQNYQTILDPLQCDGVAHMPPALAGVVPGTDRAIMRKAPLFLFVFCMLGGSLVVFVVLPLARTLLGSPGGRLLQTLGDPLVLRSIVLTFQASALATGIAL